MQMKHCGCRGNSIKMLSKINGMKNEAANVTLDKSFHVIDNLIFLIGYSLIEAMMLDK